MTELPDRRARAQNYVKAATFNCPDWMPCSVGLMPATWKKYREELEEIVLRHHRLFPDHKRGSVDYDRTHSAAYREGEIRDAWGSVWKNVAEGLHGLVVGHPLETWDKFESYQPPDPLEVDYMGNPRDWQAEADRLRKARQEGLLVAGGLYHGATYMRLYYLRGFENFMMDVATEEPLLDRLIEMVLEYNMRIVEKYLELGVEWMGFADDLGMQRSLPMSPRSFRRYIRPSYEKMFGACKRAGAVVSLHSDGHILEIIGDLAECGLDVVNPQIRANGLEGLREVAKGRVAIALDLDRQLFPFATPSQIENHIYTAVEALQCENGGLMLSAECEPDVPLENIEAICNTLEKVGGPGA